MKNNRPVEVGQLRQFSIDFKEGSNTEIYVVNNIRPCYPEESDLIGVAEVTFLDGDKHEYEVNIVMNDILVM